MDFKSKKLYDKYDTPARDFVKLKLPSGSHRLFSPLAKATYGILSNEYHNLRNIEKAGRSR